MQNPRQKHISFRHLILLFGILLPTYVIFPLYYSAEAVTSNICRSAVGTVSEEDRKRAGCEAPPDKNVPIGGGPPGPCQNAPAPPGDIRGAIIAKWGITLNITQEQLPWAWKEFHQIDCFGFLQDIRGTVVNSWGNGYAQQFSCPQDGDVDVMFSNQWTGEFMGAILAHELTHVWQFCAGRGEQNRAEIPAAYSGEGGVSRYSREGCGYASGFPSLHNEDHADTIALYMNPNVGELTCGYGDPNPFTNGRHPLHYALAKRGLGR